MERVPDHNFRFDLFLAIFALSLLSLIYLDQKFNRSRLWSKATGTSSGNQNQAAEKNLVFDKQLKFSFTIPNDYLTEKCGSLEAEIVVYVYQAKGSKSLCDSLESATFTATRKRSLDQEIKYLKSSPEVKEENKRIYNLESKHLTGPGLNEYLLTKNEILYIIQNPDLILNLKLE